MGKVLIAVRVDRDVYAKLMEKCARLGIPLSDCLRQVLENGFAEPTHEKEPSTTGGDEEVEIEVGNHEEKGVDTQMLKEWMDLKISKEIEPLKAKLSAVDELCKKFPSLCEVVNGTQKEVTAIKDSIKAATEKAQEWKPAHRTAEEFMKCDECSPGFQKYFRENLATICEKDPELCKRVIKTMQERPELFPDFEVKEKYKGFL